jgi:tetratricopeptide (TPR) repeat protein
MTIKPAEGERRAASGYRGQYLVGAALILDALRSGDLEWIRVADPEAGRVDDLQVANTGRVDGYQVKWEQHPGAITFHNLVHSTTKTPALIGQLADGWQQMQDLHPQRRIVVHLVTNSYPSKHDSLPEKDSLPATHFAAFMAQAWRPAKRSGQVNLEDEWAVVWKQLRVASGLSVDRFTAFLQDCSLDFQTSQPDETLDTLALCERLFAVAADAERVVELSREELLRRMGWTDRYEYRSKHRFPAPSFLYRPIQSTVDEVNTALTKLPGGYIGVFGPPGSGKSTLLSQTLRSLPIRFIPYYAYIPESQDPSTLRGESANFLHDVTLQLQKMGIEIAERPDPTDRAALLDLFHRQIQILGQNYVEDQIKTVVLVDGLDHIAREQQPERPLLRDLPLPGTLPDGVFIVVGSQTDQLADLPSPIRHVLEYEERRIQMGRLSPADVYTIAAECILAPETEELHKISEISDGHPLALMYLLKRLRQVDSSEERTGLLSEALPYRGDIAEQYWGHWRDIGGDDTLVHALGLLARIRGPIPMEWVAQWLETSTLRRLKPLLLQYFEEEGENRWVFFHNSFRLFLQERTTGLIPGRTGGEQDQTYHCELAENYEASTPPWCWQALYHRYSAGEYTTVVEMATQEWFLEQAEALRPLDAIQIDARLALQAAGHCEDAVALARLTLVGAALEQRAQTLEDFSIPALLLEAEEFSLAVEHLRDGNHLRVDAEEVNRLSIRLFEAGLAREAQRLFELAEPLELLSGRTILDDHTRPQNLWSLLSQWVRSAIIFRGAEETVSIVRRIRIEPSQVGRGQHGSREVKRASIELQDRLLYQGTLECARRGSWADWQVLYDALNEGEDRLNRFFALLRSAELAEEIGEVEKAHTFVRQLLATSQPIQIEDTDEWRWKVEACLAVAELALWCTDSEPAARRWIESVPPIPLEKAGSYRKKEPTLHQLRFRLGRLRYLLGESRQPRDMLREAEAATEFGRYESRGERTARHQVARAVFQLSRLWAWGQLGHHLTSTAFLQETRWILDFLGSKWTTHPAAVRSAVTGARTEVLRFVVAAAAKYGKNTLDALRRELESRWTDSDEGSRWWPSLQRELILSLVDVGGSQTWARAQLRRIESIVLQNMEPYERVEACEEQAKAWLALGETGAAVAELQRMVRAARGFVGEDDYQLPEWVRWLGRVNRLEPQLAVERTQVMIRRILTAEGVASGVGDAAKEILALEFRRSPRQAVKLMKEFLELDLIGHRGGVTRLLKTALDVQDPPINEALHTAVDLILPFIPGVEPDLLEMLILRASTQLGKDAALDLAQYLVDRISVDAAAGSRSGWYQGLVQGLYAVGASPEQVGLDLSDLERKPRYGSSQADEGIDLRSGEHLELDGVLDRIEGIEDLEEILAAEKPKRFGFFDWARVIDHLAPLTHTVTELKQIKTLVENRLSGTSNRHRLSQSLVALSERCLELGDLDSAWALAEQALDVTEASGWDPYFDGGARHAALRQLSAIDPDQARKTAVGLYARDISERFRYPSRVVVHLYDVLTLLTDEVPVTEIWPVIESYLDDLFAALPVEPNPELEVLLEGSARRSEKDIPEQAIADLLTLYVDFPSYSVAQAAIRGCVAALLDGSQAVKTALQEALKRTDQAVERALMVLDSVSLEQPSVGTYFEEALEILRSSPNFTIRVVASTVYARIKDEASIPPMVEREVPAIYDLQLPGLTLHRTDEVLGQSDVPFLVDDPARLLSPLDIEARIIARVAGIHEDNTLYRAVSLLRRLEADRTWLSGERTLDPKRLAVFLDRIGLKHSHHRPHIAPARQALSYVVAELWDAGYFPPDALKLLEEVLIHHDPAFGLWRPDQRPAHIRPIGNLPDDEYSYHHIPEDWLETVDDSIALISSRTPDDWIVVGERTRLKQVQEKYPQEDRMMMTRITDGVGLWDGLNVDEGHLPFVNFLGAVKSHKVVPGKVSQSRTGQIVA